MTEDAAEVGRRAVETLKQRLARLVVEAVRRDPERHRRALELGIIDPDWLAAPTERPVSSLPALQALERFLSRYVEDHPSVLARLGVSSLEVLGEADQGEPTDALVLDHLTVFFTDLEGFTAYTQREGDAAASRLLGEHYERVAESADGRGGQVAKRLGDGLMLTFPSAAAGVRCSLELVGAAPPPLRLRAGGHVGEVVLANDEVLGHVVNVASRVAGIATGGEVLVTAEMRDAAGRLAGCRFGDGRVAQLKGLDEPITVYAVRAGRGVGR